LPVLDIARKYAAELRSQSDLIVLLGHITGEEENQLLHSAPEIPVIVSGHLHTGMKEPHTEDGRVQVRIKSYTEELGRLELQVDTEKKSVVSWKWKAIPVSAKSVAPDPEVAAAVKGWEDKVTAIVDKPLALSKQHLTKPQLKLVAERAMREATGADYAYINVGGLRSELPEGPLLERHIWNVLPFDDEIVVGKFKGRDLPKKVTGDDKVDPDREYTLATTDFVAGNQRTKENLETTGLLFPTKESPLRTVVIDWFRKMKVIEPASR
jgi:5'-nucleotidase/UDP-sugar diphosphatase